ncbi:diaminopimelate decarboxylase [Amphritea balenae]|uniref:Diaminopimelate decarboxylase n=1 Tax=Amphritea balenae TaxID=452629 RepID=A0A3P1SLK1_9GAMM|nr:diaminopimelate decarboxylase [Amphritea balenae]RRC97162.1 diaminopimelate decarboxylase [Amphritea balenae]GGK63793.1 diaminopimelate decarboxylase [Amphritea balenae]
MDNFEYLNGRLCAEEVPVTRIAEEYGTPTYIYSRDALERAYLDYAQALEGRDALVCYAVKANSNIGVLNVLARLGAGFDIVSVGELERVIKAGGDPAKVVFSGVAKREGEMRRALEAGIHCFNIESEAELDRLNKVAAELDKVAAISLRVNPDVDAGTHPYISTGLKDNKFGVAIEDAARIYAYANSLSHLDVQGVDCHIGSQLTEIAPFLDALDRLLVLIDTLASEGITIKHLDLGGGLGVCYTDEVPPTPQEYIAAVIERLGDRPLKLIFEPGRSIAANAGIMITKVEFLKCTEHKNFAIIDGAMNDLIRPALYSAYMEIIPVEVREGESRSFDLVGPVCESGDFLGKDRQLNLEAGDLLAVCSAGAYGFGMSSNYNTRNRAAEVMVDDNQIHLIRKRETVVDQLRGESVLPG